MFKPELWGGGGGGKLQIFVLMFKTRTLGKMFTHFDELAYFQMS